MTKCRSYSFKVRAYGNGSTYKATWGEWASTRASTECPPQPPPGPPKPPAPSGFGETAANTTSITLDWTALSGITKYEIEDQADDIASSDTSYEVDGLTACTTHTFKLRAYGNGSTYRAKWGTWATTSATTDGCPTIPDQPFSVSETANVGDPVDTVTATAFAGGALTYEITAGNDDAHFAINETSGAITVAAVLDYETTSSYSVTVTVSEADGGSAAATVTITVTDVSIDYDADGNGLIEVTDLAQLHAIRWDLDGDGSSTNAGYAAAFREAIAAMGCPAAGCTGYELMADLDFDTDGSGTGDAGDLYWNDGSGWEPSGTSTAKFAATFDGNGNEIANLTIARDSTERVGLFGTSSGVVRRVGLTNVDVEGSNYVGGLVGWNDGTVTASYVRGAVEGAGIDTGGLVGWTTGKITASYSTAAVTGGGLDTGGLVGGNGPQGRITASYASGPVTGTGRVGGLVGFSAGRITASYATGEVTGTGTPIGGLVAMNIGRVTASYWDTETSGQATSAAGTGKTTSELQMPTSASGIYATWGTEWDFGTDCQYPALKVDFNGDGTAAWEEFGDQRPNRAPVFAPVVALWVAENTAAEMNIGQPTTASDADCDTLSGTDAASFALDAATGQLQTLAALDYETKAAYEVTIEVSDGNGGSASITVAITVEDVAETLTATPGVTSVALSWEAVSGAAKYRVEYRARPVAADSDTAAWTTDADTLTTPTHTVDELTCGTAYQFRVSAYGDGVAHSAAWGAASPPVVGFSVLEVVNAGLTTTGPATLSASWAYGDGCAAGLSQAKHFLEHIQRYADGTSRRGEWQGVPPVNDQQLFEVGHVLQPHPVSGSPVVRFEWTGLEVALDAEATELLTHVFEPPLSATINQAPTFDESSYAFTIAEDAAEGDAVDGVSATDEDAGDTVMYAITAGNTGDAFAIDATSGAITVAGALDRETTAAYSLTVQASDGNGGATTVTVTVTVVATPAVTVAFGQATDTATEGAATGVTVTVTLSADPLRNVTIPLTATLQGGAEAADYSGVPASVSFATGETSTTFVVVAEDDAVDDDGESLTLGFGTFPALVTAGTQATTTISLADDDVPAVTVAYGAATYAATEGAAAGVSVTVELSADPERDVTIPLTVTLQGGAEAADHSGVPASVSFATGETSKTFVVVAEDDAVDDDGESLLLGFGDLPAQVTAGTVATTAISLADNDTALTATVSGEPASHDGQTAFTFQLHFSEEVAAGFRTLRDDAFEVTGGSVTKARRLVQGSNQGWEITIEPGSHADVTVVLPVTTGCAASGAICTGDGRMLSERVEFTVTT